MKALILLFCLTVTTIAAFSQEICNNGIDDDFDGFIDCYDGSCANDPTCDGIFLGNDASCQSPPPQFPKFTMKLDFSSPNETTNHLSRMAVGDLDRDGIPEIVTMNRYTKKLFILNGNNGSIKYQATAGFEPYWEIAIANLDDDSCGEIFFIGYQNLPGTANDGVYLFAYDCQLNLLWTTAKKLPGDPINFGIADFDGDGQEEIYAKDEIYDAKTGVRIVKSTAASYTKINGGPVAVNVLGDINLELVLGLNIYQVNLGARTLDAGSLTLLQNRSEYFIRDEYNATSVADYNQDGFLDVLASGSTIDHDKNTTVFFWDVKNNTLKTFSDPQPALGTDYTNGWINGTGRLNIADLDGNGSMNASFVSGRFLYALDENFNLLWRVNINEETSGYTGCTLFDFNGDGKAEIVYRDERFLYIIQGTDGSIYSQQACISRTNREYPIVADVDADGSTELCVTCGFNDTDAAANFNTLSYSRFSHVRVFKSAAEPWVPARRVWNQHGYFVVNVNDDLTIPKVVQGHHLVFSTGSCTQGPNRPLNKFLNQSPYLNSKGCPTYAAADIAFSTTPTIIPPTCPNLDFKVSFKLTNLGDVAITGSIPVTFYTTNPKRAGAVKLNTITATVNNLQKGDVFSVDNATVTGIGSDSLYVVLNDAGTTVPTPIILPNTSFFECDYDNIKGIKVTSLPATLNAIKVSQNDNCSSANKGVARAFVPVNGTENTANYNFYWSNGTTAKPVATADYVGPVYSGLAAGTYTVYAIHKTANCNSDTVQVVIDQIAGTIPPVTINILSNQTSCTPINGQLEAVISGGGAGYKFEWYDIALNPLGISGPIANNLQAGSYTVIVSRGNCQVTASENISGPSVPDAQASVLSNVLDCTNPNSGSVTAVGKLSGVVQDPANYTFTWYKYNNITSSQESVLPPAFGTGPTRTGLPVGFYQVEVKENSSQCVSTVKPVVEVKSLLVTPDPPQIVILSSQTSCDPLQPNGVMTANVFVGGVLQNPADFTFEWFKGQNTLAVNKVTTVSDVNGKTVNQVAGGGTPYTVRVSNAFNCSSTSDLPVTENILKPVVTLTQLTPNSICDPAKATLQFSGSVQASVTFGGNPVALPDNNYQFTWRNPANQIIAVTDNKNPVLTGLADGNSYSVTVERKDLFCVSNTDTEPVVKATVLPQLTSSSTGSNNCDPALTPDGTASVLVTNGVAGDVFGFTWFTGNSVIPGNELSIPVNNGNQATAIKLGGPVSAPHPYTVLVTNKTTGCENSATQFVADKSITPVISFVNVTPNTICSPASNFNGSLQTQVDNLVGAISDYTFTWFNGNSNTAGNENASSTTALLEKLNFGFYTVQTFNTKTGCKSSPITKQVPDGRIIPAISISSTGSKNCDATLTADGTITASVTNGGTNFSYSWSAVAPALAINNAANNANQQTAIRVGGPANAPNSYQVLVTNTDTGCQNTAVGQVADISVKPTLSLQSFPNTICAIVPGGPAAFNGHLNVTAVNHPFLGSSNITYQWYNADSNTGAILGVNSSSSSSILDKLDNGKYGIRVTVDNLGCTSDIVVDEVLDNLAQFVITTNVDPSTNCVPVAPNGLAEVTAPLGAGFQYQWYDGALIDPAQLKAGAINAQLGNDIQGGAGSNFAVLVTNLADGCQNNASVNVPDASVVPTLSLSVVKNNTICNVPVIDPDGELLATVSNAGAGFTINWTGGVAPSTVAGVNGERFTKLQAGSYSAKVVNNSTGCQSTTDTELIIDNLTFPNVQVAVTPQTSCNSGGPNGALQATDGGVTTSRTFEWFSGVGTTSGLTVDGGDPSNLIDDLASADYTVRITIDATGCSGVQTNYVPENITNPQISFNAIGPVTRCDNPDGFVTPTVVNASSNFSISYVFTDPAGTPPVTSAAVIGAPTIPVRNDLSTYNNLAPGFVTAVVVNNTTSCISNPFTSPILNATSNYTILINGTAPATACGDPNGGVDITASGGSGSYDFKWYPNSPTNQNINFFNNLPVFANPVIATTEDLGVSATPPDITITTGTYTVVVKDQANGCGNYFVTNVPFADAPGAVITPTANSNCAAENGAVNVVVTPGPANTTGYSIIFYSGTVANAANVVKGEVCFDGIDNDGDGNIDGADGDCGTLNITLGSVPEGDYYIQIYDNDPLNRPCPLGFQVPLAKDVKNPEIAVDQILANTACDAAVGADGKVQLTVKAAVGDSKPKDFYLSNINPLPIGFTLNPAPGNQVGSGASGQTTGLIGGFKPQLYTFRVTDNVSKCFTDLALTVPDQQGLPSDLVVTPTPETACAPGSNGSAVASLQNGEAITRFNFDWFKNSNGTGSVIGGAVAGGGATSGEILNQAKVVAPADWAIGSNGLGSGNRTFFVRGIKNSTAPTGIGCPTTLQKIVIPDNHIEPGLSLTSTFNSFCNAVNVGDIGDAQINIAADADPSTPGNQASAGGFNYSWTNPNAILASPQNLKPNTFTIPNLGTGTFQVSATNVDNGCLVTNIVNVKAAPYFISITNTNVANQLICNPNGQIDVQQIVLDRSAAGLGNVTHNSGLPLTSLYTFKWFAASPVNPNTFINTPLQDAVGPTDIIGQSLSAGNAVGQYANMGAGSYYVVATRKAGSGEAEGCSSSPVRVDVKDAHKNPVVSLKPFSNTSCLAGTGDGVIEIRVTDATPPSFGPVFSYDYDWTAGGIADAPGNDGDGDATDGDNDREINLMTGIYAVTVTNPASGCSTTATAEVLKNSTPIFVQDVAKLDQISCDPNGDGSLNVVSISLKDRNGNTQTINAGSNISDFQFDWTRSGNAFTQTTPGTTLNVGTYNAVGFGVPIGAGSYTVVARRTAGAVGQPGLGCASAPFSIAIQDKRVFPIGILTPFANTSCDPTLPEGAISVKVNDGTLVPGPHTFTYTWDNATNPTSITTLSPGVNDGDANASDGDEDNPGTLADGVYKLVIRNNQSHCQANAVTTIFKNSTPIFIPKATATPQILCSADGSLKVDLVQLTDRNGVTQNAPFGDFEFDWFRSSPGNLVATTQGSLGAVAGGTILNKAVYAQIGLDTYFIIARRISGNLGRGCSSAPFRIDITDERSFPEISFAPTANSSCSSALPNGSVIVSANEKNGVNTGPYTFSWLLNGSTVSAPSTQVDSNNSSKLSNARDGNYVVTAVNSITSCPVTKSLTLLLDQALSTPNIIDVATVDPVDCNPTGSAAVTKITLGSSTSSILFPPNVPPNNQVTGVALNNFIYEWYEGSVGIGNQLPVGGPPFVATPSISSLLSGKYYVIVHDPTTDCRSGMKEVVIKGDKIVYPVLDVNQLAKQVNCTTSAGSASLTATADGQTDANANYGFAWFNNGTTTPPPFATSSTIANLLAGNYSVTVTDKTTSCSSSASYVVQDESKDFIPIVSMASQPRTLCVGTDGLIEARVLNLSSFYPYQYSSSTFTADLYFGANPNLSGPPDVAAMPLINGFIGAFSQLGLDQGVYTVRITDNNTGCIGTGTEEIKDSRKYPTLEISQISPVTNCDPARPNGVAQVKADGKVSGFNFDWYEGNSASGVPIYSGAEYGELKVAPQQYTVRATDAISGCTSDIRTTIKDGTVPIPSPEIEVLSNLTSCVINNGALGAYVGSDKNTKDYIFSWYDGVTENPPADLTGEIYTGLDKGKYSVTATSLITGCKSPLVTGEVLLQQEFPDFDFVIQNTSCDKSDGYASLVLITDVPIESIQWSNSQGIFLTGPNYTGASAGLYEITVTSFMGCSTTKNIEIKPDIRPYNGISRNNDGRNEFFQIDCIQNFPSNIVKIFNRAGTLVYEAEGYDNSSTLFDGRSNRGISPMGVNLPDGTYYYIVDKRDGSKPLAGYLEIVK